VVNFFKRSQIQIWNKNAIKINFMDRLNWMRPLPPFYDKKYFTIINSFLTFVLHNFHYLNLPGLEVETSLSTDPWWIFSQVQSAIINWFFWIAKCISSFHPFLNLYLQIDFRFGGLHSANGPFPLRRFGSWLGIQLSISSFGQKNGSKRA